MQAITPTIRPEPKQHEAYQKLWDSITTTLLFGGGSGGGKSWLGAEWLLTNCYRYPGSKWFIGRNELTRLMGSSYATFQKVSRFHDIPQGDWSLNGHYHYIEFFNKSRIDLIDLALTPTDPMYQRYGSFEYTGGWIEEAGEVNFMAYDVLKTRIGRWMNKEYGLFPAKLLLTCNPEQNWLYRLFYKPWKKKQLPSDLAFIQSLYGDNSYTREEYGKQLSAIGDRVLRARLKSGLWEYMPGDNSLIDYDSITDLFTNVLVPSFEKYFSADVARYGSDRIVFGGFRGFDLYKIITKTNRGIDQTSEDVRLFLRDNAIPYSHAIADDDGVGGGVVDNVRGIKGFVGNSSALKTKEEEKQDKPKQNYGNLRSQCGFMLAEKIKKHEYAISAQIDEPTKEMIIEDLQQLKKEETTIEAPLRLISKEEIKEALGRSPDYSDMMMMRMYFELAKPVTVGPTPNPGGIKPLYQGMPG